MGLVQTTDKHSGISGFDATGDDVVAVGHFGVVLRSRDGGASFERLPFDGKKYNNNAIARRHDGGLIVVCGGGRVVESSDEGASWTTSQMAHTSPIHQVACGAGLDVVAARESIAWRRPGGGWRPANLPFSGWCRGAVVDAAGNGVLVYEHGRVFALASGSDDWRVVAGLGAEVSAVAHDKASGLVVVVGRGGFVAVSEDSGATWTKPPPATEATLTAITVRGARWIAGTLQGGVLRSDDAGASWRDVYGPATLDGAVSDLAERADGSLLVCTFSGIFSDGEPTTKPAKTTTKPAKTTAKKTAQKKAKAAGR